MHALFSAVHSPLGQEISAGESPGFAWIRANITTCMGFGFVYLILVCWIQLRQMRQSLFVDKRLLPFLVCLQVLGVAAGALLLFSQQTYFLPLVYTVLLISILIQGVIAFRRLGLPDFDHQSLPLCHSLYLYLYLSEFGQRCLTQGTRSEQCPLLPPYFSGGEGWRVPRPGSHVR